MITITLVGFESPHLLLILKKVPEYYGTLQMLRDKNLIIKSSKKI